MQHEWKVFYNEKKMKCMPDRRGGSSLFRATMWQDQEVGATIFHKQLSAKKVIAEAAVGTIK